VGHPISSFCESQDTIDVQATYVRLNKISIPEFIHLFFLSFDSTGVWTWGLTLTRQVLYRLSHSASSFVLGIFERGSCELFDWAGFEP
jgi:hypothetical protein